MGRSLEFLTGWKTELFSSFVKKGEMYLSKSQLQVDAGFYLEFYLVDYARLRDGDPKSMQSMKKKYKSSCKQLKFHS